MSKILKLPNIKKAGSLKGKTVLLRSSLNVPIADGVVIDDFRIIRSLETIKFLSQQGAKTVIVSHVGRDKSDTLKPVYKSLKNHIQIKWGGVFSSNEGQNAVSNLKPGEIVLLENLRQHDGETMNDKKFAAKLAKLGEIYVNDAFAASHRSHASLVGVPEKLPSYFGLNFLREYEELEGARTPKHPSLFILGGAKFETKLPLVQLYIKRYDEVFVGGALANDIFKARGYEIGQSLVSDVDLRGSSILESNELLLPLDVVVEGLDGISIKDPENVLLTDKIVDAGPKTVRMLNTKIKKAKNILWNGPLGNYEDGFGEPTTMVGVAVAKSRGHSVVGGGDTVAALIANVDISGISFISTAGGAMLTLLETGTLPAIDAILDSKFGV
tara:strand:+ start:3316 stop:4467 length:1152 start_codon:yes stop_codon:yes gene_type:complete